MILLWKDVFNFSLAAFWTQHFQSTIHLENGKTRFIGNPGLVCIFGVEHRSPKNFAAWRVLKETFQHTDGYQLQEPEFKQRCQNPQKTQLEHFNAAQSRLLDPLALQLFEA